MHKSRERRHGTRCTMFVFQIRLRMGNSSSWEGGHACECQLGACVCCLLELRVFTHSRFTLNLIPRPFTSLPSQDKIISKANLKSPGAFSLPNRFFGLRTHILSLSSADFSVIRNRCLLLLYHLLTKRYRRMITKKPIHVLLLEVSLRTISADPWHLGF